jgi:pre-mRNA-splicing factor 38A
MANKTDVVAAHVHGTDPQYLIEKITRAKIYEQPYWKEKAFGLSAATLGQRHAQQRDRRAGLGG